ncbi:uncharacterized protein [Penaeus vannamei]|uniref:uncharacterized protein isoform X2 n=1 Tax=Penaeus vannamei TaxID=6689 RepID=UPI00387F4B97
MKLGTIKGPLVLAVFFLVTIVSSSLLSDESEPSRSQWKETGNPGHFHLLSSKQLAQSPNLSDGDEGEDSSMAREILRSPKQPLFLDHSREAKRIRKLHGKKGKTLLGRLFKSGVQPKENSNKNTLENQTIKGKSVKKQQIMERDNINKSGRKDGSPKTVQGRKKRMKKKEEKMDNVMMARKSIGKERNNRKVLNKCRQTIECSDAGGFCRKTKYCLLNVKSNANSICKGLCTCCKKASKQAENNCTPKKNCLGEGQSCVVGKANCNGQFKKNDCTGKRCGCCTTESDNKCKPKNSCKAEGQTCVDDASKCDGTFEKDKCRGKNCGCCTPQSDNKCKPKNSCKEEGQTCVDDASKCDGTFEKDKCRGKNCGCCTPRKHSFQFARFEEDYFVMLIFI